MLLVSADISRQGIGRQLMSAALDTMGSGAAMLCATAPGLPLYLKLGFVEQEIVTRYSINRLNVPSISTPNVREYRPSDWKDIVEIDHVAFGADRTTLLSELVQRGYGGAFVAESHGRMVGYAISWRNYDGLVIGPVVAETADFGIQLVSACAFNHPELPKIDLCTSVGSIERWLIDIGSSRGDRLPLMYINALGPPGNRALVSALTSPVFC
jgi:predicted N-acetyltransferase YhbS